MNVMYKELKFYKKAEEIILEINKITKEFPKDEIYKLVDQLRRASRSITANIAEGSGRETKKDYKHFLIMALGSAREVESHLKLAKELGYISVTSYDRLSDTLKGVIGPLVNYMKKIDESIKIEK